MIIHYLRIKDFLTFNGEQELNFPTKRNPKKPFSIILAPTNTGKTSTIQALRFLLYAKPSESTPIVYEARHNTPTANQPHSLINHKAKDEVATGSWISCSVEAKITIGERDKSTGKTKTIVLRRSINSQKIGEGLDKFSNCQLVTETLEPAKGGGMAWEEESKSGSLTKLLERYIPETIFNLFIFSGEPGEGRIDPAKRSDGIGEELNRYFRLEAFDEARKSLGDLEEYLEKEHKKYAATNAAFQAEEDALERLKKRLNHQSEELQALIDEKPKLEEELSETTRQLANIDSVGEDIELAIKQRTQSTAEVEKHELEKAEIEHRIITSIKESASSIWLSKAFEKVSNLVREKELSIPAAQTVPKGINLEAIRESLSKGRCATCTGVLSDEIREQLESYFEAASSREQRLLITNIRNNVLIEDFSNAKGDQVSSFLEIAYKRDAELRSKIKALQKEINRLGKKIDEDKLRSRRELIQRSDSLHSRIVTLQGHIATIKGSIARTEFELKNQKEVVSKAKRKLPKETLREVDAYHRKRERIENAKNKISMLKSSIASFIREHLQEQLVMNYDNRVADSSKAIINSSSSLVPAIQQDGVTINALGGGQTQLMELAYVVGLASLTRALREIYGEMKLPYYANETTSIIADAAFTKMADNYIGQTIQFLETAADQVILIMHQTQWDSVKGYLSGRIDCLHAYRLHTAKEVTGLEYNFDAEGHRLQLSEKLPKGKREFSTISKIF